ADVRRTAVAGEQRLEVLISADDLVTNRGGFLNRACLHQHRLGDVVLAISAVLLSAALEAADQRLLDQVVTLGIGRGAGDRNQQTALGGGRRWGDRGRAILRRGWGSLPERTAAGAPPAAARARLLIGKAKHLRPEILIVLAEQVGHVGHV